MAFCGCNIIEIFGSGGAVCGGKGTSALVEVLTYNGSGGALGGGSAIVDVPTQLWDSYEAVYLLQEQENGTAGEVIDETVFKLDGTGGDGTGDTTTVPTLDAGIGCLSSQLGAGRQLILVPKDHLGGESITVTCWAKSTSYFQIKAWYGRGSSAVDVAPLQFGHTFLRQVTATVLVDVAGVSTPFIAIGATRLQADYWYHFAVVLNSTSLSVYVDGELDGSTPLPLGWTPITSAAGNSIGAFDSGQWFVGNLQDIRISGDPRSAAWLKMEHDCTCNSGVVEQGEICSPIYC